MARLSNDAHRPPRLRVRVRRVLAALVVAAAVGAAVVAYRGIRLARVAHDWHDQVRYLIENGGTIGGAPAEDAFAVDYLEAIFGDKRELFEHLQGVIQQGLSEAPALNLGEVTAMVVTYQENEDGSIEDVVAHVVGGFPLGQRKPGFHRDGYFRHLIDRQAWNLGNIAVGFLGRDMVLFAEEEVSQRQRELIESVFSGDITLLVQNLDKPTYFTAVLPEPRQILPPQLRHHIQAVVFKGMLSPKEGTVQATVLTPSSRSANYALGILADLKRASEVALRTKWNGIAFSTPWGEVIDTWWAYEMVRTSEAMLVTKEDNLLRFESDFGRVMVNVVMKSIERMGRDLAQMRGSLDQRRDPREVDAELATRKPAHYWSEPHRWGPHWPFAPQTNVYAAAEEPVAVPPAAPAEATP